MKYTRVLYSFSLHQCVYRTQFILVFHMFLLKKAKKYCRALKASGCLGLAKTKESETGKVWGRNNIPDNCLIKLLDRVLKRKLEKEREREREGKGWLGHFCAVIVAIEPFEMS